MSEVATSKFNINFVREVFFVGDAAHIETFKRAIKSFYYLNPRDGKDLAEKHAESHFVVAAVDFTSPQKMHQVARIFTHDDQPLAHRIIVATAPEDLNREQLLFSQEIGARYVCAGPNRVEELKEYLKRVCVEAHQVGSLGALEQEVEAAYRANDRAAYMKIAEKLKDLPGESEDSLRLLAVVHLHMNDNRRAESYLRRLLARNPQHLWAANSLGKLYLRAGRGAEGIEVLKKLSQFHELNGERLLALGNAQILAGKAAEAEASFKKGQELAGTEDERFKEGLAKVRLAQDDLTGALTTLEGKNFSEDVISFLNMRAILATRATSFDEAVKYYGFALKGAASDPLLRAKLLFNLGLAYVRADDLGKAQECFRESCDLGGRHFQRARKPFETVTAVIKTRGKTKAKSEGEKVKIEDTEWETLF